jgi:hypothetical protein
MEMEISDKHNNLLVETIERNGLLNSIIIKYLILTTETIFSKYPSIMQHYALLMCTLIRIMPQCNEMLKYNTETSLRTHVNASAT